MPNVNKKELTFKFGGGGVEIDSEVKKVKSFRVNTP
jgi:hypothetical protein